MLDAKIGLISETFLPQRDGKLLTELLQSGIEIGAARQIVFDLDMSAIDKCHILVAVMDGRCIDEGVAFELGYAHARGKICLGLKTDDRVMLPSGDNPMVMLGCRDCFKDIQGLVARCSEVAAELDDNSGIFAHLKRAG